MEYRIVELLADSIDEAVCELRGLGYRRLADLYEGKQAEVFRFYSPEERELNAANIVDQLAGIEAAAMRCVKLARKANA